MLLIPHVIFMKLVDYDSTSSEVEITQEKVRSVPHIEGNWATIVFIKSKMNDSSLI